MGAIAADRPTRIADLGAGHVVDAAARGRPDGPQRRAAPALVEALDPETLAVPEPWRLLRPIVPAETWASGVTYERSRDARISESVAQDVYALVYEAERPELFLKDAAGRRTAGPGEALGVRADSTWTVPEPEVGARRSTPAARCSARPPPTTSPPATSRARTRSTCRRPSCSAASLALGPAILVPDDWDEPFPIELRLWGPAGELIHEDATSTARMARSLRLPGGSLVRDNPVPDGTVLLTGAGVVPPDDVALAPGQRVEVRIPGIGALANPVVAAGDVGPVPIES